MEDWKNIEEAKGYAVSSLGNVRSTKGKTPRILKQGLGREGYPYVRLYIKSKPHFRTVHQLVAVAFLGHVVCRHELVVNHKDLNRKNNNSNNLEIITTRENTNKKHQKSSSQYTGVAWHKAGQKWTASIWVKTRLVHLGSFEIEHDAHLAYEKALEEITNKAK